MSHNLLVYLLAYLALKASTVMTLEKLRFSMDLVVVKKHVTMELNAQEAQRISTQQLKMEVSSVLLGITVRVEKLYYVHEEDTLQISERECATCVLKGKCVVKLE